MKKKKLSQICQINPPKAICLPAYQEVTFLPMENISVDGQVNTSKTISVTKVRNYAVFKNGDVLFAKITPCMENGKGCIVKNLCNGYGAGSTELVVLRPNNEAVLAEWLYYFLSQKQFRLQCQHHMTGSAGQKRVPPKYLGMCEIPVPTIDEQKRIVSRIEELFSQLDSGVETLKTVKRQLEVYRQAVLKDAYECIENYVSLHSLSDRIFDGPFGSNLKTADYVSEGVRVVRLENLKDGWFDDSKQSFITEEKYATISNHTVYPSDLIMSTFIADSIKVCQMPSYIKYAVNKADCVGIRLKGNISPQYVMYYLITEDAYNQIAKQVHGATRPRVNTKQIKAVQIPICDTARQCQVVQMIESRLSVCDSIEKTVDTVLQQAEAMRQSILKRAFEGRLA